MKCFIIKNNEEFISDVTRPIIHEYYDKVLVVAEDEVDAKHYRKNAIPKNWISKTIKALVAENDRSYADIEQIEQSRKIIHSSWKIDNNNKRILANNKIISWLTKAEVVEIETDSPNFNKDFKLRYGRYDTQSRSNMKLCKSGNAKSMCRACGVILKNIPYYEFTRQTGKVCVGCLYIRNDAIKAAFEGMPKDFQDEFISELVLGSM
tara:strand:- start:890 stop:1510 length:621 start_codon:yes stop_codon:yes gene_type:complete